MSIKLKLTIMFLAIGLIPLFFVSMITFNNYRNSLESMRLSQLDDVVAIKAKSVESFFSGLKANIEMAQDFYNIKKNLPVLIKSADNPAGREFMTARGTLDRQLKRMQEILNLSGIILVDSKGSIVYTSNSKYLADYFSNLLPDPENKAFAEGKNKIYFSDIFLNKARNNAVEMLVTAPAFDYNGNFIGVIAFEVDMIHVNRIIQDVTGLGKTGETLVGKITDDKVVYLNPLRHDSQSVLTAHVHIGGALGGPIQEAVQGKTGSGQLIDYRGKNVIAAWRYLPSLGWGMVSKIDTEEAFAEAINLRKLAVIILCIVVLLGGIIAVSIASSISGPIKRLSKGVEIIGNGNLDYKLGNNQKDEIGQLSREFDKMTFKQKQAEAELKRHRDNLEMLVKERTSELEISNKKLAVSNENLEQFAYVASHDLQEPLRIMSSYSQLLERRYKDKLDSSAVEFIDFIVDAAGRMQRLINDLLSYSRLRYSELPMTEIDCNKLLGRVIESMGLTIKEANASVIYDNLPVVKGYEINLMQLFQNLIGNAIKFHGNEVPKVHISAKKNNGDWLFSVKDNGIGIEPQYYDRIFMIFQRLHRKDEYAGTGIGLAICKKIVENHGGRIWVESEPGKGSTFYFTILTGGIKND